MIETAVVKQYTKDGKVYFTVEEPMKPVTKEEFAANKEFMAAVKTIKDQEKKLQEYSAIDHKGLSLVFHG